MQIITGKTGTNHVTAEDDRALHAGVFGTGNYVLDVGSKFAATIETSNSIVLSDGELVKDGTHARIRFGETESVVIENGTTGYNRIDLIVARYQKVSGIESFTTTVIKGETTAGTPSQPEYTDGNILEGAELADFPMYAVKLEGVNIASVTPLFEVRTGLGDVYRKKETYTKEEVESIVAELQETISKLQGLVNTAQNTADAANSTAEEAKSTNIAQGLAMGNINNNIDTIVERVNAVIDFVNETHSTTLRTITL